MFWQHRQPARTGDSFPPPPRWAFGAERGKEAHPLNSKKEKRLQSAQRGVQYSSPQFQDLDPELGEYESYETYALRHMKWQERPQRWRPIYQGNACNYRPLSLEWLLTRIRLRGRRPDYERIARMWSLTTEKIRELEALGMVRFRTLVEFAASQDEAEIAAFERGQAAVEEASAAILQAVPDRLSIRERRLRANGGNHTEGQWRRLLKEHGYQCGYCSRGGPMQKDHRLPVARGGSDWIWNIIPACRPCNMRKGTKTESEYRALLAVAA